MDQIFLFLIGSGAPGFYIYRTLLNKSAISESDKTTWISVFTSLVAFIYFLIYLFVFFSVFKKENLDFSHIQSFLISLLITFIIVILLTEIFMTRLFIKFKNRFNKKRKKMGLSRIEKPIYDFLFEETQSLKYIEILDYTTNDVLDKGYLLDYQFEKDRLFFNIEPKKNIINIETLDKDDIIKELVHIDVENQFKFRLVKLKRY